VALVTSTSLPDGSVYHVVGYRQVLLSIATAYRVTPADLAALNRITPDQIYAGQKLLIRPSSTPTPTGAPGQPPASPDPSPTAADLTPTLSASPTSAAPAEPANLFQQLSPTQIGILAVLACGLLAFILVSLRKEN